MEEIRNEEVADLISDAANNLPAPQLRSGANVDEDSESESGEEGNDGAENCDPPPAFYIW